MKIVYVITRSDVIGGANVHLLDLAEGMQNKGHQVTILIGGTGIVVEKAKERNLECIIVKNLVREINLIKDFKCYFEIKKHLLILRPDIVHLHSSKAGILGRLASWRLGLAYIFTAHGWAFTDGVAQRTAMFYRFIEKSMAKLGGKIITVSEYDRNLALKHGVGKPEQLITIHNGISTDRRIIKMPHNDKIIRLIMVARFDIPKNYTDLVAALAKVKDLDWQVEFVGDGVLLNMVKQQAKSLFLDDKIIFSGQCHDVEKRLVNADIFLLISNWEGLPLTILEAMAKGLPIIASDVGGIKEAVWDGKNGYLIPRGDINCLADKLNILIGNKMLRDRMGYAGKDIFESHFTYELMLTKTLEIYKSVINVNS
ncbi:glycosyltransferase family 4 protein [Pasteurellaceae bacterium USgator11]|nr:glycosyltransferase family 4 protein [Pasteurellaceae bacterium USgator41]TNG96030.1 glycosyltransferase family 4 protein [Pasteurellaceae bacterium UScroc12]TNH03180.1 glycosyltransferase family 4 protein [Pasteurellaceae bacterium USgator11]